MFSMNICLSLLVLAVGGISLTNAGSCYGRIDSDGSCGELLSREITKEDCCSSNSKAGYDDAEISNESIFMIHIGIRRETCKSCQETCDNVNCGSGKRCIMKKGHPRCVCSPNCKATAAANKNRKVGSAKKIEVIQMKPEMKSMKRNRNDKPPPPRFEMQNDEPTLIVANYNRRQINRMSQRLDGKKNSKNSDNEALIYSPMTNDTNLDAKGVEMKFRNGDFNDYSISVTSYVDGFYFGNVPKFAHYNPVCGSDSKTYKNECQLRKRACRQENKMLEVAYRGHCQSSCKFIKCTNGKHCVEDQFAVPQCISCPKCSSSNNRTLSHQWVSKMVCAADGMTYRSMCELKQKSCRLGKSIPVLHRGPCTEAVSCNQCKKTQNCLPDLMNHQPKCVVCNYKCPRMRRPAATARKDDQRVCGKNNVTYHSLCHLRKDSCNTGFYIDIKHDGPCKS